MSRPRPELHPWLAQEWQQRFRDKGRALSQDTKTNGKRLQYIKSLGRTEENGETLIWVKMAETELQIDVCLPQGFVEKYNEDNANSFTSSGQDKDIFKLKQWHFTLACPPDPASIMTAKSASKPLQTLSKRVCLRIDELQLFGTGEGAIIHSRHDKFLEEFRRNERVRESLDEVEQPEAQPTNAADGLPVLYDCDLGEFAPQPRKSATAVVPSTSRSSAFKRPVNRPTAPKQTPAAITNSTFFRPTGPDTAWIEALLNDVDLSKPSRSDLEIDQLCNARIVKRVRKWQERLGSRNIDPRLLKHVEELDPASQTVESMESKTGAKGAARQETSEKEPKPLSGSRPRNAIAEAASSSTTHQRSTPISVVPGRAETLAASSVPRKGTPRQRPEQTFVLTPPRDQPVRSSASPSQRLSQSSSRDRVPPIPHSPFKPPRRSAEVSASAASESKQKGKAVDRGTPQEVNIEVAQRDGEQARIKWDGSPSQETLEQARAIEELRKKHRKEEEDARQRIGEAQRDTRPCQSAVHADSDSDSEDEVNRQLLSQDQYSQSQSKKFASSSPAIPRDRPQWSHRSDMSTNRADAPTSALRLLDRSFASSSRRQTLPRPSASAGSSSKRHTAPRLSLPASARPTPSATAPTQAFPPSTLPLPTAAQHPVLETTASMIKNALEFEFGGDSTCESFSLTFQEQGFPRGGQGQRQAKLTATNADDEDPFEQEATKPPQGERPARIEAVPASASSSSSRRKRERAGDTSQEGKENPSAHKRPSKKLESTDGGHVGRRKGPEVEEKAAQSRGKTSETDIPRTDIDLTLPTSSIEVVTIPESPARSKKRAASATQIPHSPTSLSPEQSRPSKRPRRDSRPLVAPVATAIPTQIATSQVGATLCDEWDSIVASFAAARTQKEAKGESAIEKMKRLRERRKRHEALYGNQPLRA